MIKKYIRTLLSLTLIYFFSSGHVLADTLDHTVFLQQINNSSDVVYRTCLDKYDEYLKQNPNDIAVHIEKCKFIQLAQYDDEEGYNPNQEAFDSCASTLIKQFPSHPEIFLFQASYLWGDELKMVFKEAEAAVDNAPDDWSDAQLGKLYKDISYHYYLESEFPQAFTYIEKAIARDTTHKHSLEYARILIETDRRLDALNVLRSIKDTTRITWELSNKADLYLELEDYASALALYNLIDEIDSTYNNNVKIANTLEGVGEYHSARNYLVADTSMGWNKENALKKLLLHDLKFHSGDQGLSTYNAFRNFGYYTDPIAIYRLKLFLAHPFQPWKLRDILGLMTLQAMLLLLCAIPFVWILPVYFVGHYFNLVSRPKAYVSHWGLKAFWFVSTGYLLASFIAAWVEPGYFYSLIISSFDTTEISQEQEGRMGILFILIFAVFGLAALYKIPPKILVSNQWPIGKIILQGIGYFVLYKVMVNIYIMVVASGFGITIEDMTGLLSHFLATRQEIEAILAVGGAGIGFLLICLIVPIYEEIVFRGVILDAGQRYLNFKAANVIQALLFATIHLNLYLFPVFFLFGMITGIMRKQSGGLLAGIVFHVINNFLAMAVLLYR